MSRIYLFITKSWCVRAIRSFQNIKRPVSCPKIFIRNTTPLTSYVKKQILHLKPSFVLSLRTSNYIIVGLVLLSILNKCYVTCEIQFNKFSECFVWALPFFDWFSFMYGKICEPVKHLFVSMERQIDEKWRLKEKFGQQKMKHANIYNIIKY